MYQKIDYFFKSLKKRVGGQPMICPSCGSTQSRLYQRKYWVTELRDCDGCRLLFRYPLDSKEDNFEFYQQAYSQGFTSDLPDPKTLQHLISQGFSGHEKDYSTQISILKALGVRPGSKLIDFGCSWGYGTWQFRETGYDVQAFEISRPRGNFGRKNLKLPIVNDVNDLVSGADVFFSNHVLEHVPSIHEVIRLAKSLLKKGGIFIAFTPNGSEEFRVARPYAFKKLWGKVHPNFLNAEFYRRLFPEAPLLLASDPYSLDEIKNWDRNSRKVLRLDGHEILVVTVV